MNVFRIMMIGFGLVLGGAVHARNYTTIECPVVGNAKSMIYHTRSDPQYHQMLKDSRQRKEDVRRCFKNEAEAKAAGYRKSKR